MASAFGVELLSLSDGYAQTMRSFKYAILVIAPLLRVFLYRAVPAGSRCIPCNTSLIGVALSSLYPAARYRNTSFSPGLTSLRRNGHYPVGGWYTYSIFQTGKYQFRLPRCFPPRTLYLCTDPDAGQRIVSAA